MAKSYTVNKELLGELVAFEKSKPKSGMKRGRLKEICEILAEKYNLSFYTVRTIYYTDVKDKLELIDESQLEVKKNEKIDINTPLKEEAISVNGLKVDVSEKIKINGHEIRIVNSNDEKFYVLKDLFDNVKISRSNDLVRNSISDESKRYPMLKTKYGYAQTVVVDYKGVLSFLKTVSSYIINEHTQKYVQNLLEVIISKNNSINQNTFSIQQKNDLTSFPYQVGQFVEVVVCSIVDYGVFVETVDSHKIQGLVHISEARYNFVSDLNDYFSIGDILSAKVKKIISPRKMDLSTKHLPLPIKSIQSIQEKHFDLFDESESFNGFSKDFNNHIETQNDVSSKSLTLNVNTNKNSFEDTEIMNKEISDIISYLNGIVGPLSPRAKELLFSIIDEFGIFKFTLSSLQAAKEFENDLGFILLNKIRQRIDGGL